MPKTSTNETEGGINNYDIDYIYNNDGTVDFGSNIIPTAHNSFDLGSTSFFWQTGYITSINTAQFIVPSSGPLTVKNHLLPDLDNTWDLGSPQFRFRNLHVSNLLFTTISGNIFTSTSGPLVITTPNVNDPVQINRDLVPSINNTYRVGTNALKWLAVHGTTIFTNSIDGLTQPIVFSGSLRPSSSGSYFLGSSDRVWSQGFITSLFNTTLNTRTVSGNTSGDLILTTASALNNISVDRHIIPVGTGLTNLGGSTNRYATVFANTVNVPELAVDTISSSSGNLLLTTPLTTDLITTDRNVVPSINEANSLGIAGQRWNNIRGANIITNLIGNGAATLSFDSSVAPLADLTKSIGTSSNRFLDANIGTVNATTLASNSLTSLNHQDLLITTANSNHVISVQRSVLPTVDGTLNLGSSVLRYNNLYCNVINAPAFNVDTISTATSTDLTLTTQSSSHAVVTDRNFIPTVTNTQTLGTTSLRWNQAYATTVFTGTVSNSGTPILFNGSLRPSSDVSFQIGTTSLRFNSAFIRQIYADQLVETPQLRAGTAADLNLTTVTGSNNIIAQRNIRPNASGTLNLGASSLRWATIFATTLDVTTLALNSISSVTGDLTLTTPLSSDRILLDRTTLPSTDNTYTLGNATNRWLAVYAPTVFVSTLDTGAGNLSVTGSIFPSTDNSLALGSSGQRFSAAHITTLNSSTINTPVLQAPSSTDLTLTTVTGANKIEVQRNVLPNADDTLDLGSLATRFANVYANNVNATSYNANTISSVTGNLLLTTPLVGGSVTTNRAFTPTVNNSQTLGASSLKWSSVHGTTGFFSTISNNNSWITLAGGLQPNSDNLHWLGDSSRRFQRANIINLFTDTIASTGTNNLLLTSPSSAQLITTDRNFVPTVHDAFLLGNSANRWANIYGTYVTADTFESTSDLVLSCLGGTAYSIRCKTHVVPDQNDLFNFGSSSLLWNNSYVDNTFTNNLRGVTGVITTHNSFTPSSNNVLNIGTSSLRYNTIFCSNISTQSLQNQNGTDIQCTENLIPSVTNSFSLGTTLLRWTNLFAGTANVDTIKESSAGMGIISDGSLIPFSSSSTLGNSTSFWGTLFSNIIQTDQITSSGSEISFLKRLIPESTNTYDFGSVLKRWKEGFFVWLNVNNLYATLIQTTQLSSSDSAISVLKDLIPNANNTLSLGSNILRWLNIFAETINVNQITTSLSGDLSLSTINSGNFVTSARSFVPQVNGTLDLGTSSQKWGTIHATTISGTQTNNRNDVLTNLAYGPLSLATNATVKITDISNTIFDDGNGQIKLPTKGFYVISLNVQSATNAFDNVRVQLKKTAVTTGTVQTLYHKGGSGTGTYPVNDSQLTFFLDVVSTSDRYEISMVNVGSNTCSNLNILNSRIVRLLAYP